MGHNACLLSAVFGQLPCQFVQRGVDFHGDNAIKVKARTSWVFLSSWLACSLGPPFQITPFFSFVLLLLIVRCQNPTDSFSSLPFIYSFFPSQAGMFLCPSSPHQTTQGRIRRLESSCPKRNGTACPSSRSLCSYAAKRVVNDLQICIQWGNLRVRLWCPSHLHYSSLKSSAMSLFAYW